MPKKTITKQGNGTQTDPLELLKMDHQTVSDMLKELAAFEGKASKEKTKLFKELELALTTHAQAEEKVLYPALKETPPTRPLSFEAVEEHRVAKLLLKELKKNDKDTEAWQAKLKFFTETIEHHVEEEESELLPKAEKNLSEEEYYTLGSELEAFLTKARKKSTAKSK